MQFHPRHEPGADREGKLRALAVTTEQRLRGIARRADMIESAAGYDVSLLSPSVCRPGHRRPIVRAAQSRDKRIHSTPEVKQVLAAQAIQSPRHAGAASRTYAKEIGLWRGIAEKGRHQPE